MAEVDMVKKLIIDLSKCKRQDLSRVQCSYKHHVGNNGVKMLLEKIHFALICRKCHSAPCVKACPQEALEKVPTQNDDEGVLKRAEMLCTGCGTCAIACPFGTIYTDLIPFVTDLCDVCKNRLKREEKPLCVQTCEDGSIDYAVAPKDPDSIEPFENIVVKVPEGTLWEPFLKNNQGT
ncbi:MAG: 4Fe-4S dicluster domain-containing protein [Phycisphaerae bacterium]|nr:4Fe-4S dicluster domain-containing protein [Phycisphaerae bacterium]